MEARVLVPFPRQVLLGGPTGTGSRSWYSETFDVEGFKTIAWMFEVYVSLPGAVTNPAALYLETSNDVNGPWVDLIPGGEDPNVGTPANGAVSNPGKHLRARVEVTQAESVLLALRCVAREM